MILSGNKRAEKDEHPHIVKLLLGFFWPERCLKSSNVTRQKNDGEDDAGKENARKFQHKKPPERKKITFENSVLNWFLRYLKVY